MQALVTGASSGLGRDMAISLSKRGYDLILVARRKDRLSELAENELSCSSKVELIELDLGKEEGSLKLYEQIKDKEIDLFVNNAGFGVFGRFQETDLDTELNMIDLNIRNLHILMKLILKDMVKKDKGCILNVASLAAFTPGPMMASYYASKSYVLHLGLAVNQELKEQGSRVYISTLCPGPVRTEFGQRAGVKFGLSGMNSQDVAEYAIKQSLRKKKIIIPGFVMKVAKVLTDILPRALCLPIVYRFSTKKTTTP